MASTDHVPPSVGEHLPELYGGRSYSHYSSIPASICISASDTNTSSDLTTVREPCVLGIDEAGRGPVIGPMVYGLFYLPLTLHHSLLADTHHFDDSKVLTPEVRASLMQKVCTSGTDLFEHCGWAIKSLSAQDISAGMMKKGGSYNLNAQAMDATVELIRGVIESGVNVQEIYVDTIGQPAIYQKKLERIFPAVKITVEKKADSLFPCVSAASVVAKVTRDVSCEKLYEQYSQTMQNDGSQNEDATSWGSGYPSDARCQNWLKAAIDPVFGWGSECRFSWGTVKDMLEANGSSAVAVDWPDDDDPDNMKVSHFFTTDSAGDSSESNELANWFGARAGQEVF